MMVPIIPVTKLRSHFQPARRTHGKRSIVLGRISEEVAGEAGTLEDRREYTRLDCTDHRSGEGSMRRLFSTTRPEDHRWKGATDYNSRAYIFYRRICIR